MGFLSKLFGIKTPQLPEERPFASLKESKEGRLTSEELQRRMAGRGVGFGKGFITGEHLRPAVTRAVDVGQEAAGSALSAGGLGRSSLRGAQFGDITFRGEGQIAQELGRRAEMEAVQKRNEINDALARLQRFAEQEATQSGIRAGFERDTALAQKGLAQQELATTLSGIGTLGTLGLSGLQTGLKAGSVGGFAPSSLFKDANVILPGAAAPATAPAATVNVGGLDLDANDLDALIEAIKRMQV